MTWTPTPTPCRHPWTIGPLLRQRLTMGIRRWRNRHWSIGQSALAGAVAWQLGCQLLHHPAPFFAAVAGIVCLGTSQLNRLRRVGELAVGVSVGVGVADLLVRQIGHGGWQIGLIVALAMAVALLFDGGDLIVNQAALQAVFVTVLPPPEGGYVSRWIDALLGGAVALAVAFSLPADPRRALRQESAAVISTMRDALRRTVRAARETDIDGAVEALELARGTQPALDRWADAIRAGEEITRLSPWRRRARPEVSAHRQALAPVDRMVRNLRVALRRVVAAVEDARAGEPSLPVGVLEVLDDLAGTLSTLPSALRDPDGEGGRRTTEAVLALGRRLDLDVLQATSLSATVTVAQVRSAVVDLLQLPGMPATTYRDVLPR